jgi:hypothetical protein
MYRVFCLIFTLFFITFSQASSSELAQAFAVKIDIQGFSKALGNYHKEFGRYPSTEEGLAVLTKGLNSDAETGNLMNEMQSTRNTDYTPLFLMSLFGLVLGLPIYLYKSVANWKVSGNLKASLKGFHLGVLIYLVLAPVFLGVLLFIFFNY